jgi:protocatechuate 3,4-dioxygenase beta subunit
MSRPRSPFQRRAVSRRELLHRLGYVFASAPLLELAGCAGESSLLDIDDPDAGDSVAGDATTTETSEVSEGGWATGGTAALSGETPNPFAAGLGAACALTCGMTLGPCYAQTLTRQDISEGQPGLPVRLVFLVVDENCQPLENATVDIWHTSATGLYSGEDASAMCTGDDSEARASRWFRGVQATDASGRVDFFTCFPGWYSGRTIHIHFTVRVNGTESVTSQLFFDDSLTDEIVASQPVYRDRGSRDTTNQNDGVIAASEAAQYTLATERLVDGSLLAWKALIVRTSPTGSLCTAAGGSGGGAPGGAPGGGRPPI